MSNSRRDHYGRIQASHQRSGSLLPLLDPLLKGTNSSDISSFRQQNGRPLKCQVVALALLIVAVLLTACHQLLCANTVPVDDREDGSVHTGSPVIGILTQPHNHSQEFMIAASYVKWLEAGGARSIPIPYDAPPDLVEDLLGQVHALLLPGGDSALPDSASYALTLALQRSQTDYFPVWATCLGFQYIIQWADPNILDRRYYDSWNISLPLEFVVQKELYKDPVIYDSVTRYPVTMNNHHDGVSPEHFLANEQLNNLFDITSTNVDRSGKTFVSTIEPKDPDTVPWYGVQFHPEKNAFEYATYPETDIPYEAIDHSDRGVAFAHDMSRFFVGLARKAQRLHQQQLTPQHAYTKPTLYPLVTTYPRKTGLAFEEMYIIPPASHWMVHSEEAIMDATSI